MFFNLLALMATGYIASQVIAQSGDIGLCTSEGCGDCPNTLLQQGNGYPACVIYNRDDILGDYREQYNIESQLADIYFNIRESMHNRPTLGIAHNN